MGDRISITFKSNSEKRESVAIFSHWGGLDFLHYAKDFIEKAKAEQCDGCIIQYSMYDVDRLAGMFAMYCGTIKHDIYITKTKEEGDNSDNGNYTYYVDDDVWKKNNKKVKQ